MLKIDGHDNAVIGITTIPGGETVLVYSRARIRENLMRDMLAEDAEEYIDFNVTGAYMGPTTPLVVEEMSYDEACETLCEED